MEFLRIPMTPDDLTNLIDWLKTKPYDGWYNFSSPRNCLTAQLLKESGFTDVHVTIISFETSVSEGSLPIEMNTISYPQPRTYGAALERAILIKAKMAET